MKKIIVLIAILLLPILLFTGCTASFDWDKSIKKLEESGLTVSHNATTTDELQEITDAVTFAVTSGGGDFTVEVKKYTVLTKDRDLSHSCQFFEFASEEQAQNYYDIYIDKRSKDSDAKVAIKGKIIIQTNLEEAQKALNLDFQ